VFDEKTLYDFMISMEPDLSLMATEEIAQCFKTAQLEQAYDRALRQAERIYEEERARVLRVQLMLLEDENDELQEQINANDEELSKLADDNDDLRQQLAEAEADLLQSQTSLKAQARDLEHYKAEVNALNAASSDATKILSEKLALARELATLKPELDHLKSQAATQQNILAEKLALQRELSALQVELETEKRAVQRIKAQEKSASHDESVWTAQIEDLKQELAKLQRDAQKSDRDNRKKRVEWEAEKEVLEAKLDAFRSKLKSTKDQLKEAQDELEKVQAARMAQSAEMTKARLVGGNPKKRSVARFDPDMTIGTPGNGRPAAKKQRTSVNVGDKSTFSITPFLNRTMSLVPESPSSDSHAADEHTDSEKTQHPDPGAHERKPRQEKPGAKKTAAGNNKPSQRQETANPKVNKAVPIPRLPQVAEEADDVPEDENVIDSTENSEDKENVPVEPVKKKQKALGHRTNIFDEEDNAPPRVRTLGAATLRGGAGTAIGKMSLAGLGKGRGNGKLLAEFSPLKKDRRAAAAADGV